MNTVKKCLGLLVFFMFQAIQTGQRESPVITTEEVGKYLEKDFQEKVRSLKADCPFPYNVIIDAKHSFMFGGPLGLGVYALGKVVLKGLKGAVFPKDNVKDIKKKCKNSFDTVTGGHRKTAKNVQFAKRTAVQHIAIGLFWALKRFLVAGSVLTTTWLLNKYVMPQSVKDRLALYDLKLTEPVFKLLVKFHNWRFAYNPITK